MISREVTITELRAHMSKLFRELQEHGGEIIVTEGGKPILRIAPYAEKEQTKEAQPTVNSCAS